MLCYYIPQGIIPRNTHDNTPIHALGLISKLIFSTMGKEGANNHANVERRAYGQISKMSTRYFQSRHFGCVFYYIIAYSGVCNNTPLGLEKLASEIRPRGCGVS